MTEEGWTRLALGAAVVGVGHVVLLVALWKAPEPPDAWPQRASPARMSDAPPTDPTTADPEELRAGMKALDTILATRLDREARARGRDPAELFPPADVREAGIAAGDPGSEAGARLIRAYDEAFTALGAPLEAEQ